MNALLLNRIITSICAIAFALSFVLMPIFAHADFNQEINYQGKLTDSSGLAVADGTYNMYFWLIASSTAASSTSVWSEVRTGANKVQVTNGLFSVMLGEVTSLASVDFNQTLYLGVEIGGTGSSPTWDGEMSPRKVLGAVPASFVAESANTFAGLATTSFLRADEIDTMQATSSSALLTLIQNGAGKIMSLFSGATEMFTVLNNGNVGIGTTTPSHKLTVSGATNITGNLQVDDDSLFVDATNNRVGIGTTTPIGRLEVFSNTNGGNVSYLSNLNTGTGAYSEFNIRNASTSDTYSDGLRILTLGTGWTTVGAFVQDGSALMSGSNLGGGMSLATLNASANMRFYTGGFNDANERMRITSGGLVGIGTTSPVTTFAVNGSTTITSNLQVNGGTLFADATNNRVGIGTTTPSVALTVSGNISVYDRLTLNDTDSNSALGYQAGKNVVSGAQYNTFLGYQAGFSSSTASTGIADNNTAIGALSLYSNTTGFYNTAIGSQSMNSNTAGSFNVALGSYASYSNTAGIGNVAIGISSLYRNTTGISNTAIGFQSSYNNIIASSSVAIGYQAAVGLSSYQNQGGVYVGFQAGFNASSSSDYNTMIGYQSGYGVTTGAKNILLGYNAGYSGTNLTTGSDNIIIGNNIGATSTAMSKGLNIGNLIFGTGLDGTGTTLSSGNIGIGTSTPSHKLTVIGNTYLGGNLSLTGSFSDSVNATGTSGQILSSTGTSTLWTSTSALGLGDGTFLGLSDTQNSFTANRLIFTNSGATALTDSANLVFDGTNFGIGSTTPSSKLTVAGSVDITNTATSSAAITLRDTIGGISMELRAGTSTLLNTFVGVDAGKTNTTGSQNTSNGYKALYSNTTGSDNSIYGFRALYNNTTGSNNTALGSSAGRYIANGATGNDTSSNSLYLGYNTKALADGDTNEIVIGYTAVGAGSNSVTLGSTTITTTILQGNIGIGTTTPSNKLTVYGDINISDSSQGYKINNNRILYASTTNFSTLVGNGAGQALLSDGSYNTAFGYQSLYTATSSDNNTAVGYGSLYSNTTGYSNTATGLSALNLNTTGSYNTANGFNALYSNTNGSNNIAVGYSAGSFLTNGASANASTSNSVFLGYDTRASVNGGINEIVIGAQAIGAGSNTVTLGSTTIATTILQGNVGVGTTTPIGKLEVVSNTNGGNTSYLSNTNTGTGAYTELNIRNASTTDTFGDGLRLLTMGTGWSTVGAFVQDGTALMSGANLSGGMSLATLNASANMRFYTGGLNDANERMRITSAGYVGIGTTTPSVALTVSGNISVYDRLTLNDTDSNSALGYQAGKNVVSGAQYNTFLGYQAGFSSSTGSTNAADYNTAIGALSLYSNTTGNYNTALGMQSLYKNTTGTYNTALGLNSLYNNATGTRNTSLGFNSMGANTGGGYNAALGYNAMGSNIEGSYNTALGYVALNSNRNASSTVAIGYAAAYGQSNYYNQGGVYVGFKAGFNASSSSDYNTMIGYQSGYGVTTGAKNILLGYNAGYSGTNLTTGSDNIIIGNNIGATSTAMSKGLNIGNLIFGTGLDGTGTTLSSGNIGIGTSSPSAKLTITQSAESSIGGIWLSTSNNTDFRSQYIDTNGVLSFYGGDTAGTLNTATLNAAGEWTNASDVSYKENIEKLSYGLEAVLSLQPRSYDIKNTDNHRIGFIAQEVEEVVPEVVSGEDGAKGISYGNLVAVAISAIQELANKVNGFTDSFTSKFIKAESIDTKQLCLDELCITKEQLQNLLDNQTYINPVSSNSNNNNNNNNVVENNEVSEDIPVDQIEQVPTPESDIEPQLQDDTEIDVVDDTSIEEEVINDVSEIIS